MTATSMMAVMERHTHLDALFLEHQTAVLDRDLTSARGALEAYAIALDAHMTEEQTHILPLYQKRVPEQPGAQTQMFLDEHARIRLLLADLQKKVDALCSPEKPDAKSVLALLDQETQFKNYMDHHDRRERAFLYPGLDGVLSTEEREELLATLGITTGP